MSGNFDQVRKHLVQARKLMLELEGDATPVYEIRDVCKTAGGHLTDDGKRFVKWAKGAGLTQATIARILDISATAASRHYNTQ